ncbi:phosphatidylglycerophosphatase A family protein [Rubeoparvulum massiliense]|uniref:phosphatidylglycerophosphatase A family protein n=1 Tax=Rubeoparvulum massiliense TaxID=1631346 RepID=UPI00065E44D4|nr:phosphatidylglycerophosphatase A [Rubeoparvulum massiliense]
MENVVDVIHQHALQVLRERGVHLEDIAQLVYDLQSDYQDELSMQECRFHVDKVLEKREIHNAIITGIEIDRLAEEGHIRSPLLEMIRSDEGLYGVDEVLAFSITNVYGSIGLTNFGYLDKLKPGILKEINAHLGGQVNTFLDDIVAAIAAAASSRLAHNKAGTRA